MAPSGRSPRSYGSPADPARPRAWWHRGERLGPYRVAGGARLELRTPRLRDAAAWTAARLAERERLEAVFPAWGEDWASEQDAVSWVVRCADLRRAGGLPYVAWVDGVLVGEMGVDAIEDHTGTGEISSWFTRAVGASDVVPTGLWLLCRRSFAGPRALDRLVAPVAVGNRGPARALTALGFTIEARRTALRGGVDHDVWALPNTPVVRAALAVRPF